ncbi:MAG TPA: ATP-binding protein, partial [Pyrinomonadaceae bacterium]
LIELLYADIAALHARGAEGRARRELVGRVFRHVHTIKGSASAAGLEATGGLAHEFETLLDAVRMGRVALDGAVLGAFEEAVGAVAAGLSAVARGGEWAAPPALVEKLRRLSSVETTATGAGEGRGAALPEEVGAALGEYERQRLREALAEGARAFVVAVSFDSMTFDERFRELSEALSAEGEVISTLPGVDASAPDRVTFRIVHATAGTREQVLERIAPFGASLLEDERRAVPTPQGGARVDEDVRADEAVGAGEGGGVEEGTVLPASAASLTMLVRVPLEELDELISATHELFTDTVGTFEMALAAAASLPRAERTELEIRAPHIRRRFFELEERLIELRMVPVRATLERAARVGQSVARLAGREVEFVIEGGEVRLDKSLADAVADPLLHLLRNAVDHGIESPEERRAAGKPERGRVALAAAAEGSRVTLRVADDGRGVDTERVTRAAVERGLLAADARVGEQQALRLIFRPGFSTAGELSSVSGRGVGLDVVERMIEQAGGELRVRSRRGEGTTFEMRLPTTLALVPSIIVRAGGDRYCVDSSHVVEAAYVSRADVKDDSGDSDDVSRAPSVSWRGETLPLVSLRELLTNGQAGGASAPQGERLHVVIARAGGAVEKEGGERRAAVAVDGWDGHVEVLVRGLGRHGPRWRGVSGATELGDGTVALMLDLPRLLDRVSGER